MSASSRFTRTLLYWPGAAVAILANRLLLIALLLGLASAQAAASDAELSPLAVATSAAAAADDAAGAEPLPQALSPRMHTALDYVKKRYKVSKEALLPLFDAVQRIARERSLDPLLIVALIGIESGFQPHVKSATGGHGLMQIIPRYHLEKIPDGLGVKGLMDPEVNVKVGAHILDDSIRRGGGTTAGLQVYNGSDRKGVFARRVLAERARLEQAP